MERPSGRTFGFGPGIRPSRWASFLANFRMRRIVPELATVPEHEKARSASAGLPFLKAKLSR